MIQSSLANNSADMSQADALKAEQTKLLYGGLPAAIAINGLLALLLAGIEKNVINQDRVYGWLVIIGSVLLARSVLAVLWRRSGSGAIGSAAFWMLRFRVCVIATGVAWGLGAALLFPPHDELHQVFLAYVLAGLCAGAITALAVDRVSTIGFLVPTLFPLIVRFVMENNDIAHTMSAMVLLFLIFVIIFSTRSERSLHENFQLKIKAGEREQLLRDSELRFRTLFNNSRDALLANAPPNWQFTWVNRAAVQVFGFENEAELLSLNPWEISPEYQADGSPSKQKAREMVDITLRDGSHVFEWEHKRRDDTTFPAEVLLTRMELNKEVFILGSIRDITERKRLEREIRERSRELDMLQKSQVATQTAAAIAHELNQPLLAIASYTEAVLLLLKSANPDMPKIHEIVEKSGKQAMRAGKSMRDLLDYLSIKEFPSESFDLNREINELLATVRSEHQIQFRSVLNLEKNLPLVHANRMHIQRVLFNLLYNGVEAMQHAGVPRPSIIVTVRTIKEQNVAQTTIQDNGPGIDQSDIHRIFEPLFTTKPNGIGMGLAISRSLVEANGGQLWVNPDEGPGATFHMTLPFA